jgi:lysophospholipase L1-like esterase
MNDLRICFVGESFVNGVGDRTYLGWTGRVCQQAAAMGHTITYYNLGVRRETSTELVERWQPETRRRFPYGCDNRIVFSFGTNDTTLEGGRPRVEMIKSVNHARHILSLAQQQYPTLMISPPPIADSEQNQRTQTLLQNIATICQDLEIPFLDVFTPLLSSDIWRQEVIAGDGAHPDAGGYAALAQLVQKWAAWRDWFTEIT